MESTKAIVKKQFQVNRIGSADWSITMSGDELFDLLEKIDPEGATQWRTHPEGDKAGSWVSRSTALTKLKGTAQFEKGDAWILETSSFGISYLIKVV